MNIRIRADTERLTNYVHDFEPSWSPDGSQIAFHSPRGRNTGIHVMNADGSGQTRLTYVAADYSPSWSPDGSQIAFQSRGDNSEIYVINADGSGRTNITNNVHGDYRPSWSP